MSARRCFDCGANAQEAAFPGLRKPRGDYDRCCDCLNHPLGDSVKRIAARRAEIARLRAGERYWPPKPFHTLPLFAGLRAAGGEN